MAKLDYALARGAVHLVSAGALVFATGACTVLYNPDNISRDGGAPGTVDAPPGTDAVPMDAGPRPDAMPGDLEIYELSPDTVEEGVGEVRKVPVAITGANMEPGAMVQLEGPGLDGVPQMLEVSEDGTLAVFEIGIPVDTALGDSAVDKVTVTVTQGGQMDTLTLNVDWLDELLITSAGTLDGSELDARYSRITISENVEVTGAASLRLVATAEIVLSALVAADGLDAMNASGGTAQAGGCKGGNMAQNGDCTPGGGLGAAVTTAAGGGGGGHAVAGSPGTGNGAAAGGGIAGTEAMTNLANERGNGGGGGGDAGMGQGGGGGGGGGVIELTSFGTFRIDANGRLSVRGGDGAGCGGSSDNGGGGGGSGGAILLRSAQPISGGTSGTLLTLDGGQGGSNNCNGDGGAGARGRARVDATALPAAATSATPFHGAVLAPDTPAIVNDAIFTVTVLGGANKAYAVLGPGAAPQEVMLNSEGRGTKDVTLVPGINRVCVLMTTTDVPGGDDENCLDIAYVPQP
jgi:hypothetical protein